MKSPPKRNHLWSEEALGALGALGVVVSAHSGREAPEAWRHCCAFPAESLGCSRQIKTLFVQQHSNPELQLGGPGKYFLPEGSKVAGPLLPTGAFASSLNQRQRLDRAFSSCEPGLVNKASAGPGGDWCAHEPVSSGVAGLARASLPVKKKRRRKRARLGKSNYFQ